MARQDYLSRALLKFLLVLQEALHFFEVVCASMDINGTEASFFVLRINLQTAVIEKKTTCDCQRCQLVRSHVLNKI